MRKFVLVLGVLMVIGAWVQTWDRPTQELESSTFSEPEPHAPQVARAPAGINMDSLPTPVRAWFRKERVLDQDWGEPQIRKVGEFSQISFRPRWKGLEVHGGQNLTLIQNPLGRIVRVEGHRRPVLIAQNRPALSEEELAARFGPHGRTMVWVTSIEQPSSREPIYYVKYAYETRENGYQRIYDRESGRILHERNRRQY